MFSFAVVGFYLPTGGGGGGGGGQKLMKHKSLKLGQGYDPLCGVLFARGGGGKKWMKHKSLKLGHSYDPLCKYQIMLVYDKLKFQYALQ